MNTSDATIKSNSIISILSLFFQSGYSALLGLVANLFLTILLTPAIFGIYITVLALISLLNYFSDIGLAASLIQRHEIDDDDVKTAFTIQQILVITAISIFFLLTGFVKSFYALPQEGVYLFWALLTGFFLSSLKTIPSVFLERKVQFQKIVFVQIVENTAFYITVIVLAFMNFGLLSFAYAVLVRSILGVCLIYSISFWIPKIGINKKSVRHLLSFGLPFQSISFLALFKDDLVYLFLGKVIGFEALGYIGWAKKWAEAPLRIIMDSLSRVLFPVFSRFQNDTEKLKRLIQKVLRYQTMILFPASVGLFLLMPTFVEIIPRYKKWEVALPLFFIFVISSFFSSFSTPFINLFNALGKVKLSFFFMLFWTVSTWVLIIPFTHMFGYYGFPLTILILSLTFVFVLYKAKQLINFNFISSIYPFLICGVLMGICVYSVSHLITYGIFALVSGIIAGIVVYYASLRLIFSINITKEVIDLIKTR